MSRCRCRILPTTLTTRAPVLGQPTFRWLMFGWLLVSPSRTAQSRSGQVYCVRTSSGTGPSWQRSRLRVPSRKVVDPSRLERPASITPTIAYAGAHGIAPRDTPSSMSRRPVVRRPRGGAASRARESRRAHRKGPGIRTWWEFGRTASRRVLSDLWSEHGREGHRKHRRLRQRFE